LIVADANAVKMPINHLVHIPIDCRPTPIPFPMCCNYSYLISNHILEVNNCVSNISEDLLAQHIVAPTFSRHHVERTVRSLKVEAPHETLPPPVTWEQHLPEYLKDSQEMQDISLRVYQVLLACQNVPEPGPTVECCLSLIKPPEAEISAARAHANARHVKSASRVFCPHHRVTNSTLYCIHSPLPYS
jgi:hypothetical protein